MTRRIAGSLLLTALLSLGLHSQSQEKYLVSITLDASCDRDKLEALHLPIYCGFDNVLIAGVPEEKVNELVNSKIPFIILDDAPWSQKYYLLSTRKGMLLGEHLGKVIWKGAQSALIKASSRNDLELNHVQLTCVEFRRESRVFRNERIMPAPHENPPIDSVIASIVPEINRDSVRSIIQGLQDFGTRFMLVPTRHKAAEWIRNRFLSMGIMDVVIDSFLCHNPWPRDTITWQKNVVATLRGTTNPDRVFILGGHYDSFSTTDPYLVAPGADDNASGTAAVLEMARVMMKKGYHPKSTVQFVAFAAEELMLSGESGCGHYASKAKETGMKIELMINHDMISHSTAVPESSHVEINYYSGSEHFLDLAKQMTQRFSLVEPLTGVLNQASDSYPFWQLGFPAVYFEEYQFSPYYHTPQDIISNYNLGYCAEVVKASCATVISQASTPQRVRNLTVTDIGDGTSLLVCWVRNTGADVAGYRIRVGTSTGSYDSAFSTTDTSFAVRNLTEGVRYFIGVSAYDIIGNESFITERSGIPYVKPLAPSNVSAEPQWQKIVLRWSPNRENDLAGYNIYRATSQSEPEVKLNSLVLRDTTFTDTNAQNGVYYYYSVTAADNTQHESQRGSPVRSRAVSLDKGILIADETKGGDGSPMNPTDTQVDSFYGALLAGYTTQLLDVEAQGGVTLADLGAFSTVVWHGNDPAVRTAALNSQQEVRKYLGFGGKLFITSYRPTTAFGNNSSYPRDFNSGEFLYDYLKIRHVENKLLARFVGAGPIMAGYPPVYVDTTKTQQSFNYHLTTIEGINAAPGASNIYTYETNYDTAVFQGKMRGQPVGIEYLGSNFKVVLVSFPLYYMRFDQAKSLLQNVLVNKFSEPLAVPEYSASLPTQYTLSQNYPNPFNPSTTIRFCVPSAAGTLHIGPAPLDGVTSLRVYDVLGREAATLVNGTLPPGNYSVQWDATGFSSGVYFYQLTSGPFVETRKLILIR